MEIHGRKITSDDGLLAYRELDEVPGPTDVGGAALSDLRRGKSTRRLLAKRVRMSEAIRRDKCIKTRKMQSWIAGFVTINGRWAKMTGKLIWINESIGGLRVLFQNVGVFFGAYRPKMKGGKLS